MQSQCYHNAKFAGRCLYWPDCRSLSHRALRLPFLSYNRAKINSRWGQGSNTSIQFEGFCEHFTYLGKGPRTTWRKHFCQLHLRHQPRDALIDYTSYASERMVSRGGRSKGCSNCRKRRVKCGGSETSYHIFGAAPDVFQTKRVRNVSAARKGALTAMAPKTPHGSTKTSTPSPALPRKMP